MINNYVAITPHLKNIAYNSKEADHLPPDPVLSILHFTFHPGVNVTEPSQLAYILWQKSLKFVSTVPGFRGMYWSTVDHTSPHQQLIVLIQYDSGKGWKLFQSSLGFSMMLGYIESISNRCIQSVLPVNLTISDSLLELVSFRFSGECDQEPGFKSKWEAVFAPYLSNISAESDLLYCCGEWLEADQASEDRYFVGMFFWKPDSQNGHRRQLRPNDHNLEERIADLVEDTVEVVSVYTRQLSQVSSRASTLQLSNPYLNGRFETNHPVFRSHVKPQYNLDENTFAQGQDQCHLESMRQARQTPRQRIAGGPAGVWYPMGKISQHHLPQSLGYSSKPTMDWIFFRAQLGHPRVDGRFEDLRRKLWGMGDCPQIFWGKIQESEGDGNLISLFIGMSRIRRKDGAFTIVTRLSCKLLNTLNTRSQKSERNSNSTFTNSRMRVGMRSRTYPIEELPVYFQVFAAPWTWSFLMSLRMKWTNAHLDMPSPFTKRTFEISHHKSSPWPVPTTNMPTFD
jgi:hypothetical protein